MVLLLLLLLLLAGLVLVVLCSCACLRVCVGTYLNLVCQAVSHPSQGCIKTI